VSAWRKDAGRRDPHPAGRLGGNLPQFGKQGAEPNFKGFGLRPLLGYCDNTAEPLAGMLRPGSAGSNTAADHLAVLDAAITALPPGFRRRLMVTCDGAGASHDLITRLDKLAARPGYQLICSVGWELGARERAAIAAFPARAWQIAVDARGEIRERRADQACSDPECAHRRCWIEEAHVTELASLLREGPAGDQLSGWPAAMRVFARRERPHPGAQLTLFEARDGDEDAIRTGKDCGIGKYPSTSLAMNNAWQAAALTAAALLAWLRLLALDGPLARAGPKTLRYRVLHVAARLTRGGRQRQLKVQASWPWPTDIVTAWHRISALPHAP